MAGSAAPAAEVAVKQKAERGGKHGRGGRGVTGTKETTAAGGGGSSAEAGVGMTSDLTWYRCGRKRFITSIVRRRYADDAEDEGILPMSALGTRIIDEGDATHWGTLIKSAPCRNIKMC